MAVPTNVRSFYNSSHVSDYFGDRPEWDFHHGVDFAHGAGTPVPALRSGTVALRDTHPDLGNYVVVQSGPNDYNGYCHLRGVPLELGQSVTQGQTIGYLAGYDDFHGSAWDGPHLHFTWKALRDAHLGNADSKDPWPLVQSVLNGGSPGSPGGFSFTTEQGKTLQRVAQKNGYSGPIDGDPGVNTWKAVQGLLNRYGFYSGPVDGVPGTNTWRGVQKLAQLGGYAGPIDGIPGDKTFAGLKAWLAAGANVPAPSTFKGVYGVDISKYQAGISGKTLRSRGFQFCIVKLGGSNISPRYVDGWYQRNIDSARQAGLIVGHYWLVGAATPEQDADYFMNHLYDYRKGDILAVDNEKIDNGQSWNDDQVARFINRVKARLSVTPFMYISSNLLKSQQWSKTKATGAKLWVAHHTEQPGNPSIGTAYPTWHIHQYSDTGFVDGRAIDLDVAKLSAFTGLTQPPDGETAQPTGAIPSSPDPDSNYPLDRAEGKTIQRLAQLGGYEGPVDGEPGNATWTGVQRYLSNSGYYSGPIDGIPGVNTFKGIQELAVLGGYTGPVDGALGPHTLVGLKHWLDQLNTTDYSSSQQRILQLLARGGGYTGPIDGAIGRNGWTGVQRLVTGYGYNGPIDGAPGQNTWMGFQRIARLRGYSGPIDGEIGPNSWAGMQTFLQYFGYTGPLDGEPGAVTYAALQRLARLGGYAGPIDGDPGPYTWLGFQRVIAGCSYTGPIDGDPGLNTFKGIQVCAQRGGYTGPVDGIPGTYTFGALANLVRDLT